MAAPPHAARSARDTWPWLPAPWRTGLAIVLTLAVLAASVAVVQAHLSGLPRGALRAAFAALAPSQLAAALAAVIVSYACLSAYDVLALRDIGAPQPWRKIAPDAAMAFAVSNALGAGFLSGGQVRRGFYQSLGLSAAQSKAVRQLDALTLFAGALTVSALCLLARAPLPPVIAGLAALLLLALALMLSARLARSVVKTPGSGPARRTAVLRLLLGMADWSAMALVLYVLLPDPSAAGFAAFVPLFTLASLAGVLSNLPAGLGVFDAVILIVLPHTDPAAVAAALAGYRALYFALPLVLGALATALAQKGAGRGLDAFMRAVAPMLFSLIGFGAGALMLAAAMTPAMASHLQALERLFPLLVIEVSHFLASIIGMLLLIVSAGLARRLNGAWLLAVLLLAAGTVLTLLKGDGFGEAALLGLATLVLWLSRPAFYRKSPLMDMRLTPGWLLAIAVTVLAVLWLGFFSFRHVEYRDDLWWSFSLNGDAPRFLRASAGMAALAVLYLASRLLRPHRQPRAAMNDAATMARVKTILAHAEHAHAQSCLALLGDKQFIFSQSGESFVMYGTWRRSWIALGGPVGKRAEWRELVWAFREQADLYGARAVFYSVHEDFLPLAAETGLSVQKIGETALIDLPGFSLQGPRRARLRQALRRAQREGCSFEIVMPGALAPLMPRLQAISDDWLSRHQGAEKGFSLGRFSPDYVRNFPVALVRRDGVIVAFSNIMSTHDKAELAIDMMRQSEQAPAHVMEYLFIELALWGQQNGYGVLDLAMAPLAGLEQRALAPWAARLGAFVYNHGDRLYGFEGLRRFKNKFAPRWTPVYIAAPPQVPLPLALGEVALMTSGGLSGLLRRE